MQMPIMRGWLALWLELPSFKYNGSPQMYNLGQVGPSVVTIKKNIVILPLTHGVCTGMRCGGNLRVFYQIVEFGLGYQSGSELKNDNGCSFSYVLTGI